MIKLTDLLDEAVSKSLQRDLGIIQRGTAKGDTYIFVDSDGNKLDPIHAPLKTIARVRKSLTHYEKEHRKWQGCSYI